MWRSTLQGKRAGVGQSVEHPVCAVCWGQNSWWLQGWQGCPCHGFPVGTGCSPHGQLCVVVPPPACSTRDLEQTWGSREEGRARCWILRVPQVPCRDNSACFWQMMLLFSNSRHYQSWFKALTASGTSTHSNTVSYLFACLIQGCKWMTVTQMSLNYWLLTPIYHLPLVFLFSPGGLHFERKDMFWLRSEKLDFKTDIAKEGYLKSLRAFQPYAERDALPLRQTQATVLLPAERAPHSAPLRL